MKKEKNNRISYAFIATFLSIIGVLIVLLAKNKDKYVIFYTKQSIIIFFVLIIGDLTTNLLRIIPLFGKIINLAIFIIIFLIWSLSWIYALSGKMKKIPVISYFAEKIKF